MISKRQEPGARGTGTPPKPVPLSGGGTPRPPKPPKQD